VHRYDGYWAGWQVSDQGGISGILQEMQGLVDLGAVGPAGGSGRHQRPLSGVTR
jgi:hypothetical protein